MKNIALVLTTMPADGRAEALARMLVEERLAACVTLVAPIRSVYRWKDAITSEEEQQLLIKTTAHRVAALRERLLALHPYELPEFVVLDAEASDGYVNWVGAATIERGV
ncbi:MAG: divalent-cation tolerance protein CutA [Acidobacteriaceae bacterium]|jgi:periplasmic divalent cation tolerance protein|nr:divalent-cation tolerance protein CutA [Acidobacteriaceae bacterium]